MTNITTKELYELYLQYPHISTDSRNIIPASIFFALKGENFDGNHFAQQAIANGAAYAIVDNKQFLTKNSYCVGDVLKSLQQLAAYHRKQLSIPILAITGSNGKTTTKELIHAVLGKKYRVVATKGNLNNHIGVPLTLLNISTETEIAIIEMGANHKGEIMQLCEIAKPNYGIITNIGKAHLGKFGGLKGVVEAKNELYQWLQIANGTAVVNQDNDLLANLSKNINSVTYGSINNVDVQGKIIGNPRFLNLVWSNKTGRGNTLFTHLVGEYNFENALAAICVGNMFGVETDLIKKAIEEYVPSNSRSQAIATEKNFVILDAYNANPTSMRVAIENFSKIKAKNKIPILGDMLELGDESHAEHIAVIKLLTEKGFTEALLVGKEFMEASNNVYKTFKTAEEACTWLKNNEITKYTVLVKGSRGIKMEKVLEGL